MTQANGPRDFAPERYRAYLHLLARLNLPRRLRGVLSASDLAHDTILKAHKKGAQFRGQTEAEYRAWLRRILANTLADAARVREPDLLRTLEQSSAWLEGRVAVEDPSPSAHVARGAAAPAGGGPDAAVRGRADRRGDALPPGSALPAAGDREGVGPPDRQDPLRWDSPVAGRTASGSSAWRYGSEGKGVGRRTGPAGLADPW